MQNGSMVLGLLAALTATGCHHEHHERHEVEGKFEVTSPLRRDTELTREYVAQIRAYQHIEVRAQEHGYLTGISVDEGQRVEEGQKMFQIMPRIYQAEMEKAEAEAEFSQIELRNTKVLAEGNVVSPNELALARAKMSKAKAELALAKVHRDLTQIRAPFSGIMGRFHARRGSLLEEGELLTTLSDNSTMWVYFNVTESEYLDFESNADDESERVVSLTMANGQTFAGRGKIETIEADFNNETGNIAFRAAFPNPDGLLRHGQTGKILMTVPVKDALIVPQKATFEMLDKKYVFVIDEHGTVRTREIEVAHEMPHLYVVARGLDEKDRILLEGLRKVRDGKRISVEYRKPEKVFASLDIPVP